MSSNARLGYGAQFKVGDGATPTENFTALSEVIEVAAPKMARDTVDATHHGSTNRYRDFIAGLRDGGEVSLSLNYTNAAYVTLLGKYNSDSANNYQVVGPNGAIWQFSAFITGLEDEIPIADKMAIHATFKITGQPTYTAGS